MNLLSAQKERNKAQPEQNQHKFRSFSFLYSTLCHFYHYKFIHILFLFSLCMLLLYKLFLETSSFLFHFTCDTLEPQKSVLKNEERLVNRKFYDTFYCYEKNRIEPVTK